MTYHSKIQARAAKAQAETLGGQLLKAAACRDFSVIRIAACTGATRQTVYQWYRGRTVSAAYKQKVQKLVHILEKAKTADKAWSTACKTFNLTT